MIDYDNEMQNIIKQYSSICYQCSKVRKPASDDLLKEGWCGCILFARIGTEEQKDDIIDNIYGGELAEGWVNLTSYPKFNNKSAITNFQLLTKEIISCKYYIKV